MGLANIKTQRPQTVLNLLLDRFSCQFKEIYTVCLHKHVLFSMLHSMVICKFQHLHEHLTHLLIGVEQIFMYLGWRLERRNWGTAKNGNHGKSAGCHHVAYNWKCRRGSRWRGGKLFYWTTVFICLANSEGNGVYCSLYYVTSIQFLTSYSLYYTTKQYRASPWPIKQ